MVRYIETNLKDKFPKWSGNYYFYKSYIEGILYGMYNGTIGHMKHYLA